jgi:hypothetical protein
VRRVLELTAADQVLGIYPSLEAARLAAELAWTAADSAAE